MEKESNLTMYTVGQAGKQPDINMGSHQLYSFLKEHKVIHSNNSPFQEYVQKGFFKNYVKVQPWNRKAYNITLVTDNGLNFIKQLLENENL